MIVVEVCKALDHAHSLGVIHRDIKPENIMIRDDGVLKLTDFGIAQVVDVQRLTVTGQLLGSPAYMAPELVEGKPIDFRADVFSVGTVLYQLATGELPFKGQNPHELLKRISDCRFIDPEVANPVVGSKLSRIIRRALAHDPEQRYQAAELLQQDLKDFLADVELVNTRKELQTYFADHVAYSQRLQEKVVSTLTQRGKEELDSRRTPQALEFFNRVLCVDPKNAEVLTLLDQIARRRKLGRAVLALLLVAGLGAGGYALYRYWPLLMPAAESAGDGGPLLDLGSDGGAQPPDVRPAPDLRRPDLAPPAPDQERVGAVAHITRVLPSPRQVRIIPRPGNVTIWLNDQNLGSWDQNNPFVFLPRGRKSVLVLKNPLCWDKKVEIEPGDKRDTLIVKLDWRPALVQVTVDPDVPADVQVGRNVSQVGEKIQVNIPNSSNDGRATVVVKVSPRDAALLTHSERIRVRANTLKEVRVKLRRSP
jgi:serine/threonine-protein kinase